MRGREVEREWGGLRHWKHLHRWEASPSPASLSFSLLRHLSLFLSNYLNPVPSPPHLTSLLLPLPLYPWRPPAEWAGAGLTQARAFQTVSDRMWDGNPCVPMFVDYSTKVQFNSSEGGAWLRPVHGKEQTAFSEGTDMDCSVPGGRLMTRSSGRTSLLGKHSAPCSLASSSLAVSLKEPVKPKLFIS